MGTCGRYWSMDFAGNEDSLASKLWQSAAVQGHPQGSGLGHALAAGMMRAQVCPFAADVCFLGSAHASCLMRYHVT